jgi:hypothetical protein
MSYGCDERAGAAPGNNFSVGFDMEKIASASATGENVSTGGMISIHLKNVGTNAATAPTRAHIVAVHSAVLELKDSGCFVYS